MKGQFLKLPKTMRKYSTFQIYVLEDKIKLVNYDSPKNWDLTFKTIKIGLKS